MNDINFFWQIVTNLFDVLLLNYFLYVTGRKKKIPRRLLLLGNVFYFLSITFVNIFIRDNWVNFAVSIFFAVTISMFYKDRMAKSLIYTCIFAGTMLVAEMFSSTVIIVKNGALLQKIHYVEGSLLAKIWELLMIGLIIRFRKETSEKVLVKSSMLYVIISVLCLQVSMCFTDNFELYQTDRLFSFLMGIAGILFLNLLVYVSFEEIQKMYQKAMEAEVIKCDLEKKEEHYRQIEKNQEEVRRIRHDLKHQLTEIKSAIEQKESAKESREALDHMLEKLEGEGVYCPNVAVNVILKEKLQQAKEANIKVEQEIHISDRFQLELGDMGILLGNLLDNAMEASSKVEDPWIHLNMFQKGKSASIIVKNKKSPLDTGGIGKTTKKDKKNHGIGLNSVKQIVEKYHGVMEMEKKEQEFCVKIMIFQKCSD